MSDWSSDVCSSDLLKEMESLVLNAETKINKLEYDIFVGIRDEIEKHIEIIQKTSENIAVLDVLCSFATCSNELGYVKPLVDDSLTLEIRKGRHPVIERTTEQGRLSAKPGDPAAGPFRRADERKPYLLPVSHKFWAVV